MVSKNKLEWATIFLTSFLSIVLSCSMGGSTEQGNAKIRGFVTTPSVSKSIEIQLVSKDYNPFYTGSGIVFRAQTDTLGNYSFDSIPFGSYYLYAHDDNHRHSFLNGPYEINDDEIIMGSDTLKSSSSIRIKLLDSLTGVLVGFYIKGSTDTVLTMDNSYVSISGVPSGTHDVMIYLPYFAIQNAPVVYTEKLMILPADTISISYRNRPPQIITHASDLPPLITYDTLYRDTIKATDPDSDKVTFSVINPPALFTMDSLSGIFSWTPVLSDSLLQSLKIVASDPNGANSYFVWNIRVKSNSYAPTPSSPTGTQICSLDSTYTYTADIFYCATAQTLYRFWWGDGDTSSWSPNTSTQHTWSSAGTFSIRVQVQCNDFGLPSAWSSPKSIQVNKTKISDIPSLSIDSDTFNIHETIHISADSLQCTSSVLYKFFLNDSDYTDWRPEHVLSFVPNAIGKYEFRVSGWCDTATTLPSARSDPYTLFIDSFGVKPPNLYGDSIYTGFDTVQLLYQIFSDSCLSGGLPEYRFSIYNKDSTRINDNIGYLCVRDTLNNAYYTTDSVFLTTTTIYDTTSWSQGNQILLFLMKPSGPIEIKVQAKCNDLFSTWSSFYIREQD